MRLIVDNDLGDFAIGGSVVGSGTTVWWEVDPQTARDPAEVFAEFTGQDYAFTKTRTRSARSAVSRSSRATKPSA